MARAGSILRQLSLKENWRSTSKKWTRSRSFSYQGGYGEGGTSSNHRNSWKQMGGLNGMMMNAYSDNNNNSQMLEKKRVMVVVDQSSSSKHAMMWALTHVANKGDLLTLLQIISPSEIGSSHSDNGFLASSLGSLCKACKPEFVEVEALVIHGPKLSTVLSQVKKLEVSVLVLGQKKPSSFISCLFGMSSSEDFVEQCISYGECLTIGVRKQSKGMGGYLISTKWQKNFWLLA
ncbi:uncharacterized protein [Phyllobates terribilis]|uniref:uncharacterized protein n=1 Tax=Phyllobates terribilis TaxID=111132 RepID=UPI003CCB2167